MNIVPVLVIYTDIMHPSEFPWKQIDCSEILLLCVRKDVWKRHSLLKKWHKSITNLRQYFNLKVELMGQVGWHILFGQATSTTLPVHRFSKRWMFKEMDFQNELKIMTTPVYQKLRYIWYKTSCQTHTWLSCCV